MKQQRIEEWNGWEETKIRSFRHPVLYYYPTPAVSFDLKHTRSYLYTTASPLSQPNTTPTGRWSEP